MDDVNYYCGTESVVMAMSESGWMEMGFHDAVRCSPYYLGRSVYGPFTKMSSVHDVINLKTINFPIGEKPPFDEVRSSLLMTFSGQHTQLQRFLITVSTFHWFSIFNANVKLLYDIDVKLCHHHHHNL